MIDSACESCGEKRDFHDLLKCDICKKHVCRENCRNKHGWKCTELGNFLSENLK